MVTGQDVVTVGEQERTLRVGQHVDITIGEVHRLTNLTDASAEIVEVQYGDYLGEDDIVRLSDDYGRS